MTPLLLALGASLAWGVGDFFGPLVSRSVGVIPVLAWAQVGGVVGLLVAIGIRGEGPAGWGVLYATAAAVGGMLGLFAYYRGMVAGTMSVVAPIAGASAVIPVVFGIATGDSPSTVQIVGRCALAGVMLRLDRASRRAPPSRGRRGSRAASPRAGSGSTSLDARSRRRSTSGGRRSCFAPRRSRCVASIVATRRIPIRLSRRNVASPERVVLATRWVTSSSQRRRRAASSACTPSWRRSTRW